MHSFTQGVPANDTINMSFWRATIGSHRAKGNYKSQQKKRKVLPDSYSCHSPQPHFSLKNKGKACSSLPSNKKKKKKIFNLLLKAFSFPSLEAFHLHLCYHLLCKYVTHFNTSKYWAQYPILIGIKPSTIVATLPCRPLSAEPAQCLQEHLQQLFYTFNSFFWVANQSRLGVCKFMFSATIYKKAVQNIYFWKIPY